MQKSEQKKIIFTGDHARISHQPLWVYTYPCNIAAGCPYVVYVESNAARILRDEGALFQRVVDAFDAVIDHSQQEATDIKNGRISKAH